MNPDNLTIADYQKLLQKTQTENQRLTWKLRLNEATVRSFSMRDVISALAQVCSRAVFFLDESLNVSFFEGSNVLRSQLAQELLKKDTLRFSDFRFIVTQHDDLTETKLDNGDTCYSKKFIINSIEPFYLLLLTNNQLSGDDVEFLFDTVAHCFTTIDLHRKHGNIAFGDFKVLMNLVISNQLRDWDEIEAYMKRLPTPPKRYMSIGVIRIDAARRSATNASSFLSKLRSFFPGCTATVYEDFFIILVSSNEKNAIQPRPTFDQDAFSSFLSEHEAFAAFSNATQRMDMLRSLYILAESTLRLGRTMKTDQQQRILFFEDYADYVLIELVLAKYKEIMGHDDMILLTNPHVVQIYRHDKLHGTNLQTVLYNYCQFKGNISAAAKASFMHRNTFAAKVAEIKALISDDLNDPSVQQRMIFSYKIFQFVTLFYDNQTALSTTDRLNVVAIREENQRSSLSDPDEHFTKR